MALTADQAEDAAGGGIQFKNSPYLPIPTLFIANILQTNCVGFSIVDSCLKYTTYSRF